MTAIHTQKPTKPSSATPAAKTKGAQIEALLRRKKGARLDDLTKATGWQRHSIRAALTGLRKAGLAITRERDAKGATVYRIIR